MILKIGISGKRHIPADAREQVKNEIEDNITHQLTINNCTQFIGYTSLAIGADTIFAEVVTNVFKQPLQIILPFPVTEFEKDFTISTDLEKFQVIISGYKNIETLSHDIPADKVQRNLAYFETGKHIVDICDEVIFVWDGLKPSGMGGTAEIIGYYCGKKETLQFPLIRISPANEDLLNNRIFEEYKLSDRVAIKNSKHYKKIGQYVILLGWLAVILFAVNTSYSLSPLIKIVTLSFELSLVIIVFILIAIAKKKNFHGKYLKERLRAETFRILKYFYHANVEVKISSFTVKEDKVLSELAEKVNKVINSDDYISKWYSNYMIKNLINRQRKYHIKKIKSIGNKPHYLENINIFLAFFFLLNQCLSFVVSISNLQIPIFFLYDHRFTFFLSICIPSSYAAIEGIIYFHEWKMLKKYSKATARNLKSSILELPKLTENNINYYEKQCSTLNLVGGIMLTDNKNWELILEEKNNFQFIV